MHVGVFRLGVRLQVGGFGGPVGILPYDERLVQGVEAVTAQGGGVDGEGFLVALGVCEVQGEGVGDPAVLLEGADDFVDEVGGHGFFLVGQDDVHVSAAMPPISDTLFKIKVCLRDSCEESTYAHNVSCYFIGALGQNIKSWESDLPFRFATSVAADNDGFNAFVRDQAAVFGNCRRN